MFKNFEVNQLFEGQVNERPHFSVNIEGQEYKGMVQDGKVHWYHPHPQQKLGEELLNSIESKVNDLMSNHLES
ncbi:DUF5342 family protein [Bacillus benzoevorans]|uniref:Uncharacterized protein n=1 Tax=Bacillus benzoevorans TaxID=1456 RepID=A0A7X0HP94_9BACI|nr:DUF5342 family protein [Bacillus benzoevorans]MBB6444409.1 hypothetical protein [Bacillus benzoevorans]